MDAPEAEDGDLADPSTARAPPNSSPSTSRAGIRMVSPPPAHARGIVMPAREVLASMSRAGLLDPRLQIRQASMVSGLGCESGRERGVLTSDSGEAPESCASASRARVLVMQRTEVRAKH